MSQPLLATDRIVFNIAVGGLAHKLVAYVKQAAPIMGVPQILDRDGITTHGWDGAAQYMWDLLVAIYDSTTPPAAAELQNRSGIVWNPVAGVTLTSNGIGTGIALAGQLTYVLRDTAFKHIRYTLMETTLPYAGHEPNGFGLDVNADALLTALTSNSNVVAPFNWQKSRGDRYILASGACAGGTLDLNDKLRRRRSLS
jgi:hypothetical protein